MRLPQESLRRVPGRGLWPLGHFVQHDALCLSHQTVAASKGATNPNEDPEVDVFVNHLSIICGQFVHHVDHMCVDHM